MGAPEPIDRDLQLRLPGLVGAPVKLYVPFAGGRQVLIARLIGAAPGDCVVLHRYPAPGEPQRLQPGQRVVARLVSGDGMLQFRCVVARVLAAPLNQIQLAWPSEIRALQLRGTHRVPADLLAAVIGADGREQEVVLADFSESGCQFASPVSLGARGAPVRLQFRLPNRPDAARRPVSGAIRWVRWGGGDDAQAARPDVAHFTYGIRFAPDAQQRQLLQALASWVRMESVAVAVRTGPADAPPLPDR